MPQRGGIYLKKAMYIAAPAMLISHIIIGVTVVASFYAWNNRSVFGRFMMNPYAIDRRKEYHRFLTSGLIHQDHAHLFLNMLSFYFFGPAMEAQFMAAFGSAGQLYFIAFYLMAIVVSDIPTFLKHRTNPGYNSLGASGAVSAVIFAFIIFKPVSKICLYFFICMPGFLMGALFIIFSYYQGKKANDNINHDAHLYGALFGLLFCVVLYPSSIPEFFEQLRNWSFLK